VGPGAEPGPGAEQGVRIYEFLIREYSFALSLTANNRNLRVVTIVMSPLRRHIFVCFMAKSAFWVFSALAP